MEAGKYRRLMELKHKADSRLGMSEEENMEYAYLLTQYRRERQERERAPDTRCAKQEMKTQDFVCGGRSPSEISKGKRPTFREAMKTAEKQIELDSFLQAVGDRRIEGTEYMLAKTLCLTMAEVYMAQEDYVLYVGGMQMPSEQAQTVYREIRPEHIECLIKKIQTRKESGVKYQRPYLRTMLYNIVFEYEAQIQAGMDARLWE